ncbi:hypothetical protein BH11PSE10_BH11PSE10_19040 [soil metagenome]
MRLVILAIFDSTNEYAFMQQRNSFLAVASLALVLLLPSAPAQASEVVKLARLVITGKRLSSVDATRSNNAAAPQGSQVANEARHGGGDDVLGAADGQRQFRPI